MEARAAAFARTIEAQGTALTETVDERTAAFTNRIDNRMKVFATLVASRGDALAAAFDDRQDAYAALVDDRTAAMLAAFDERVGRHAALAEAHAQALASALDQRNEAVAALIDGRNGAMTEAFDRRRSTALASLVEARGQSLARRLAESAETITRAIEERGGALVETLDGRGGAVVTALTDQSERLRAIVEGPATELVEALALRGDAIERSLRDGGAPLLDAIRERTDALTAQSQQSAEAWSRRSTAVPPGHRHPLERQRADEPRTRRRDGARGWSEPRPARSPVRGRRELRQHRGEPDRPIAEIRETLAAVTGETARASAGVAEQVDLLKAVAEGALQDAAELAASLDARGRTLGELGQTHAGTLTQAASQLEGAAGQLVGLESALSERLAEREAAIAGVLARIEERSGALEAQTTRFDAMIGETLRAAEERARALGASLSETATGAGASVTRAFEGLRSEADGEAARTAQAVQAAIEAASRQMTAVFDTASTRFGESVSSLHAMASEIRRELDATRADLQRGVLDIPRETQDATGEMRRVVSEQLKALTELSTLVSGRAAPWTRSRLRSRSPAGRTRPRRPSPPRSSPHRRPPRRRAAPAAPKAPLATRPGQTINVVSAPARTGDAVRPGAPARTDKRGGDNRGWLSDLLTRASLDDDIEAAPPVPAAKAPTEAQKTAAERGRTALETISNDIAKMLDHQTAVDLWERYRRGEPNLFDSRIYTAQGRQTFEEVRRRYAADAEFRRTVDRYVGEFERLLGDVSKNDRDSSRADAYLTSETGKVYTMLAHASGRFEGA